MRLISPLQTIGNCPVGQLLAIRRRNAGNDKVRDGEVAERMTHAKAGVRDIEFDSAARQPVWIKDGNVVTAGEGAPWIELCAFPAEGTVPVFLLEDKRTGEQIITAGIYAPAETGPYPNPLPEDLAIHDTCSNRVVYQQYLPYIGCENLFGYAHARKTGIRIRPIELPPGIEQIRPHESAQQLRGE